MYMFVNRPRASYMLLLLFFWLVAGSKDVYEYE